MALSVSLSDARHLPRASSPLTGTHFAGRLYSSGLGLAAMVLTNCKKWKSSRGCVGEWFSIRLEARGVEVKRVELAQKWNCV